MEQQNFLLHNEPLFSEDTPLSYKFFRDGIRQLIFRPGLTQQEMVTFTLIALSEPERGADDALAQLWKANMEHVEYVVVEGFTMDGTSEEEVAVEVDKVVGYLYARLRTNSEDYLRFARVSAEDLDAQLEGVEQIRGVVVQGTYASDALKAKLQKEIEEEENARLFPKLVSAIFQVVEGGVDDVGLLEEIFVQLLDAMLIQDDYGTINQMVLKLRALGQREETPDGSIGRLLSYFVQKMADEQRLNRLGESLKRTKPKNPADITRYLQVLDEHAIIPLLTVLETIEVPENRILLCDVLAGYAKDRPDPFVIRLQSDRPQTRARHRLHPGEEPAPGAHQAVRHGAQGEEPGGEAGGDEHHRPGPHRRGPQADRGAAAGSRVPGADAGGQAAAGVRPREGLPGSAARGAGSPSFEKKTADERTALYAALVATGVPNALTLMTQLMSVKPALLNKKKVRTTSCWSSRR